MDKTYELVRSALAKPGCTLCRVEREAVQRYLDGFMYEDVTDVGLRAKMRAARGFCHEHAAQAIMVRDSLGLAIIYQDILSSVEKDIGQAGSAPRLPTPGFLKRDTSGPGQRLARHMTTHRACPACAVRDEIAEPALRTLVAGVQDSQIGPLFAASDGLCLPHFAQAAALATSQEALATLAGRQRQVIDALVAELAEFIRKHDYRFRQEQMATEIDSWRRAMELVIGGTLKT
jgi:hypothetical protein